VHIRSLHAPVRVTNVDTPSHKIFQIFKYETFYSALQSLPSHRVWCHQNIYWVHRNTMLHFSVVHLVNMNAPVCTFTNTLCKNIFDKGVVKWTCQCVYVCQCTTEKGNKVRSAPCKFTGRTIGGASREP
jgi:hypothetical protein